MPRASRSPSRTRNRKQYGASWDESVVTAATHEEGSRLVAVMPPVRASNPTPDFVRDAGCHWPPLLSLVRPLFSFRRPLLFQRLLRLLFFRLLLIHALTHEN